MAITGTQVRYELTASADATSENVVGSFQIGTPISAVSYTTAPDVAYSLVLKIADGDTLTFDASNGAVTGETSGVQQVETVTVTAAAGCTANGTATVIVTSANVTGSPITLNVALTTADNTAALVASKIATAIGANTAIAAKFNVLYISGASFTLTAKNDPVSGYPLANDSTLNVSVANGTCSGITAAPTSANTTVGVIGSRAYRINGMTWDQTDFEGKGLPVMGKFYSALVKSSSDSFSTQISSADETILIPAGGIILKVSQDGTLPWNGQLIDFAAGSSDQTITIDIHAGE